MAHVIKKIVLIVGWNIYNVHYEGLDGNNILSANI